MIEYLTMFIEMWTQQILLMETEYLLTMSQVNGQSMKKQIHMKQNCYHLQTQMNNRNLDIKWLLGTTAKH